MELRNYKSVSAQELVKYKANSRTHSDEQIAKIVRSINEFGFTNPLLIDEHNVIIAGHGRLAAALEVGLQELPCIVLDGLTDAQKAALVIADNKIALDAGWDKEILLSQFDFLKEFDYDLTLTGFDLEELADIFPEDLPEVFCGDDELPGTVETKAQVGDLWLLGDHRLLCGDSTVSTDVVRLLGGQNPNTMITDPPYGVKYEADWRAKAKGRKKTEREENSNLKNDDQADWFDAYVLFTGSVAYVWHASLFTDVVMDGLRRADFDIKQHIIWNKNVHALSHSDYHWKHEPCWYAVKKSGERNWKGGRTQMTVWDVPSISCEKTDKTGHPTQKPAELFIKSITHHTNPGEYVYDPFAGSGTLMIACEKTKRRALMMELDPKYCDMIIQRYENYSGQKAIREATDGID